MRDSAKEVFAAAAINRSCSLVYCLKTNGGPLTRLPLRLTVTSTTVGDLDEGNAFNWTKYTSASSEFYCASYDLHTTTIRIDLR